MSKAKRPPNGELISPSLSIISLGWPIFVATFSNLIVGIVDTAVVGRLGTDYLAGAAAALAVFAIATETLSGLLLGFEIILARLAGARDSNNAANLIGHFAFLSIAAAVAATLLLVFSQPVLVTIASDARVGHLAMIYLLWRIPSLLIMAVAGIVRTALDVSGLTKPGMFAALAANMVNGITAPIFVFGVGPVPALGIAGAGLAGTLGGLSGALVIAAFWLRYQPFPLNNASFSAANSRGSIREVMSLSAYEITNAFLDYAGNLLFVATVAAMGVSALAASRIAFSTLLLCFMICGSFATASQILMSREFGSGHDRRVRSIFKAALLVIPAVGSVCGAFLIFGSSPILRVYTGSLDLSSTIKPLLLVVGVTTVPLAINAVFVARLRAAKASRSVMFVNVVTIWTIQLPVAWFFGRFLSLGVVGAYLGVLSYFVVRVMGAGLILRSTTRRGAETLSTAGMLNAERQALVPPSEGH